MDSLSFKPHNLSTTLDIGTSLAEIMDYLVLTQPIFKYNTDRLPKCYHKIVNQTEIDEKVLNFGKLVDLELQKPDKLHD